MEFIDGENEECKKQRGSFKRGSSSKLSEAARAVVAACGDWIRLIGADDSHLMALGAAMKGSPIRSVRLYGSFTEAGVKELKRVADASGLTVQEARPGYFRAV